MPIYPADPSIQRAITPQPINIGGAFDAILSLRMKEQEAARELFETLVRANPDLGAAVMQQNPALFSRLTKTPTLSFGQVRPPKKAPEGPRASAAQREGLKEVDPKRARGEKKFAKAQAKEARGAQRFAQRPLQAGELEAMFAKAEASLPAATTVELRPGQLADIRKAALANADAAKAAENPGALSQYISDYTVAMTTLDEPTRDEAFARIAANPVNKIAVPPMIRDAKAFLELAQQDEKFNEILGPEMAITDMASALRVVLNLDAKRLALDLSNRMAEESLRSRGTLTPAEDSLLAMRVQSLREDIEGLQEDLDRPNMLRQIMETLAGGASLDPTTEAIVAQGDVSPEIIAQKRATIEALEAEIVRIEDARAAGVTGFRKPPPGRAVDTGAPPAPKPRARTPMDDLLDEAEIASEE